MFRKPKRSANSKAGLRRKSSSGHDNDDDDENNNNNDTYDSLRTFPQDGNNNDDDENENENDQDQETTLDLQDARKRIKLMGQKNKATSKVTKTNSSLNTTTGTTTTATATSSENFATIYSASKNQPSHKDLATSTNEIIPTKSTVNPTRNKFLAGPIRAPTNIRTTARFDYQPDICKDYKDTGFCGFGDTCIYLHDRGDTMSGWQLEQAWQKKQESKKQQQEQQMEAFLNGDHLGGGGSAGREDSSSSAAMVAGGDDDGLPFACYICRGPFEEPIITPCGHYFCQSCLQRQIQDSKDSKCPICQKETHGVMNQPTKLLTTKKKLLGRDATWQQFMDARRNNNNNSN
jgi:RING finger protein 113A